MTEPVVNEEFTRLNSLARFFPEFNSSKFDPGEWSKAERDADGAVVLPYATLTKQAEEFVRAAYENGWVIGSFDWSCWAGSREAKKLRDDESALAKATAEQIARLLTVVIRQDRFCEGALLDAFNSGLILRIVRRIDALSREFRPG